MKAIVSKSLLTVIIVGIAAGGGYWYYRSSVPTPEQRYRIQTI